MVENSFKYSIFDRRSMILNFNLNSSIQFFSKACAWRLFNLFLVVSFSFNFLQFVQFMSWLYVCSSSPLPITLLFFCRTGILCSNAVRWNFESGKPLCYFSQSAGNSNFLYKSFDF